MDELSKSDEDMLFLYDCLKVSIRIFCLFNLFAVNSQRNQKFRTMNVQERVPKSPTSTLYWGMLKGLNDNTKRELAVLLVNSIGRSVSTTKNTRNFFDGLSNAWDDGISPEEETEKIRKARMSGVTRILEDF